MKDEKDVAKQLFGSVCGRSFCQMIAKKCDELKEMLLAKNEKYGNSAFEPCRIFSSASPEEQLLVRIDDKLSRIKNRPTGEDEDVVMDLAGYLILLMVNREYWKGTGANGI